MTTDEPQPTQDTPRRTMSPELRELLNDPIFRLKSSPNGGGVIITGVRPPATPADEPRQPEPDATHDGE